MKRKLCFMFINAAIEGVQRTLMEVGPEGEMHLIGVNSYAAAVEEAKRLADEGFVALELCAGFGIQGQAEIMKAVEGKMLVGAVRFDNHPAYGGISGDEKWLVK